MLSTAITCWVIRPIARGHLSSPTPSYARIKSFSRVPVLRSVNKPPEGGSNSNEIEFFAQGNWSVVAWLDSCSTRKHVSSGWSMILFERGDIYFTRFFISILKNFFLSSRYFIDFVRLHLDDILNWKIRSVDNIFFSRLVDRLERNRVTVVGSLGVPDVS